ncbi:hypothetical protein CXG81DRAFT_23492 [Caulochytrium protostelioides]|uniref:Uncharacterized protein n=1 Tax=Caulochytrium protostelioides TaxID=1555241 RepID=A0A4P9XEG5_9FUNG|nr:hypothetical protein CXG81DRAFT_23492 [Caulochytrium protostelioides]|eukprot:RKP03934.1 hypothetical protein CXG81DRAFT_23492 [Caulochytrium protostelioides]
MRSAMRPFGVVIVAALAAVASASAILEDAQGLLQAEFDGFSRDLTRQPSVRAAINRIQPDADSGLSESEAARIRTALMHGVASTQLPWVLHAALTDGVADIAEQHGSLHQQSPAQFVSAVEKTIETSAGARTRSQIEAALVGHLSMHVDRALAPASSASADGAAAPISHAVSLHYTRSDSAQPPAESLMSWATRYIVTAGVGMLVTAVMMAAWEWLATKWDALFKFIYGTSLKTIVDEVPHIEGNPKPEKWTPAARDLLVTQQHQAEKALENAKKAMVDQTADFERAKLASVSADMKREELERQIKYEKSLQHAAEDEATIGHQRSVVKSLEEELTAHREIQDKARQALKESTEAYEKAHAALGETINAEMVAGQRVNMANAALERAQTREALSTHSNEAKKLRDSIARMESNEKRPSPEKYFATRKELEQTQGLLEELQNKQAGHSLADDAKIIREINEAKSKLATLTQETKALQVNCVEGLQDALHETERQMALKQIALQAVEREVTQDAALLAVVERMPAETSSSGTLRNVLGGRVTGGRLARLALLGVISAATVLGIGYLLVKAVRKPEPSPAVVETTKHRRRRHVVHHSDQRLRRRAAPLALSDAPTLHVLA